jgi:hypothetical protein
MRGASVPYEVFVSYMIILGLRRRDDLWYDTGDSSVSWNKNPTRRRIE